MIYLDDLRNATGGQLFGEIAAREFTGFCHDPDFVETGQLYVALRSGVHDGQDRIAKAIERGATGVLCHEPPTTTISGVTVVIVGDTTAALGQWVAYVLRQYGTMVIAVAGVVGKSVTASSIGAVLGTDYAVQYAPNYLGGIEGLAISLGGLDKHHQFAIVEIATRREGEITSLLAMIQPTIAVITGLDARLDDPVEQAHSEAWELIRTLPPQGMVVINHDDPQARSLIANVPSAALTISTSGNETSQADIVALNVEYFVDKVGFDLKNGMQRLRGYWTPAIGEAGLEAALAALAVGLLFEVPIQRALDALKSLVPLPGHMMVLDGVGGAILLDDSANSSITSTLAALRLLQTTNLQGARRFVVLGNLAEVPWESSIDYQELGRQIAGAADYLVTIGGTILEAAQSAINAGMSADRVITAFRHPDAARVIRGLTQPEDVVLIAGAQAMQMHHITAGLLARADDAVWLPTRGRSPKSKPSASSWIEINLDGLANNLSQIKERIGSGIHLMAVVKGNAYGHGIVEIASTALHNGAALLGVAHVEEGIQLRRAGIHKPILVLGSVPSAQLHEAIRVELTLSVWDREGVRRAASIASEIKKRVLVHIRVDTGFGDYGLPVSETASLVREIVKLENVVLDGIYTDFAAADTLFESAATHEQLDRFQAVVTSLRATGISIPYVHAANSCAILTLPSSYFTTVRAGIILYGLHPSVDVSAPAGLQRILSWKTTIGQIKTINAGVAIGYGSTFRADQEMKIAILPVGYADGFRSGPRNWGEVLVGGKRARIVGRVGMDRCVIDVTGIANISVGQEVVLIGSQGTERILVEDVARRLDCTNYEVIASLSSRIPRIPSWSVE